MSEVEAVELPIDGTLDLHAFNPGEIRRLVPEYVSECRRLNVLKLRIIHGKGTGALQRTVHAILDRLPEVAGFSLAGGDGGGWGATLVDLYPVGSSDARNSGE